jgi:glycosyltransferase involved in cell wall biosynthesis
MRVPEVSVVTPVKNGERYLAEAIESVLGQTLANWEYVIVDGGSHDDSLSIARKYEQRDDRIAVISSPDRGMYDAVFKGFQRTTAPICCWLPSDDKFMPWAFETVAKYMVRMGAEWVTGIPALWDSRGLLHYVSFPQCYLRTLIRLGFYNGQCLNYIQQASTFFSRDLLTQIGADNIEKVRGLKGAGDFFLWTRFALYSSLQTIPTVLSGFRQHGANWSSQYAANYHAEISSLGFHVPSSRAVGKVARLIISPLALWRRKRLFRNWHRLLNSEPG